MTIEFITADDEDGYSSTTADTHVFVKAGVLLGGQDYALGLFTSEHDVTVQGAVVGVRYGIYVGGPSSSSIANCTLSVAEGGLVAGIQPLGSGDRATTSPTTVTSWARWLGSSFPASAEPLRSRTSG